MIKGVQPKGIPVWIRVEDRLPEIGEDVLVYGAEVIHGSCRCKDEIAVTHLTDVDEQCAWRKGKPRWVAPNRFFYPTHAVTHWMPLPEPPKDVKT